MAEGKSLTDSILVLNPEQSIQDLNKSGFWDSSSHNTSSNYFASGSTLNSTVTLKESLTQLIQRINNNEILSSEELNIFANQLAQLKKQDGKEYQPIITAITASIEKIYAIHQREINQAIEEVSANKLPNTKTEELNQKYTNLLNAYHLGRAINALDLPYDKTDLCLYHLPFAINALTLTGKLPTTGQYGKIQFGKALYPPFFTSNPLLAEKKELKKVLNTFWLKRLIKFIKAILATILF